MTIPFVVLPAFLQMVLLQIIEGDELNAVDGVLVKGLKPSEVSMLIRGPVGSAVEIEVIP